MSVPQAKAGPQDDGMLNVPPKGYKTLIEASVSDRWEEAQREWTLTGESVTEVDADFPEACEFCQERNIKTAYRIRNIHNHNERWLGSECIKRYIKLDGAETVEDSARRFTQKMRLLNAERNLRLFGEMITERDITPSELKDCERALRQFIYGQSLSYDNILKYWDEIVVAMLGDIPGRCEPRKLARVKQLVSNPQSLLNRKVRFHDDNEQIGHWGSVRQTKQHVVGRVALNRQSEDRGADVALIAEEQRAD